MRSLAHLIAALGTGSASILIAGPAFGAAIFLGLGDLPGGDIDSIASGVSADGSVVVGRSSSESGVNGEAFRWTASTGIVGLGDLPGGEFFSEAYDVSPDGSVIVGTAKPSLVQTGFRWTISSGMEDIGGQIGVAASIDGSVVVGQRAEGAGSEASRWTAGGGVIGLGELPGGTVGSVAQDVSWDGSVIVGASESGNGPESFLWTAGGGMVGIGDISGGVFQSQATAVSGDGSIVVGEGHSALGREAFVWRNGVMTGLGDLPGGAFDSGAFDVSGDGSVVVGRGESAGGPAAFIWDATHGMRDLRDVLVSEYGLNLTGWTLEIAHSTSADGTAIVGWGTNPQGNREAWIAIVPEPSTGSLAAMGALALGGLRRARPARRICKSVWRLTIRCT